MSRAHPETDRPELGWCNFCQRTGVAAYRVRLFGFGPGSWRCTRCGAAGPAVDRRLPLAEWAAFDAAMRVQPRVVRGRHGRFETVEPVGGRDGAPGEAAAEAESGAPGGNAP